MKKITKKNLEKLEKEMPTLSETSLQQGTRGENSTSGEFPSSCVYNALDYIDGDAANRADYYLYGSGTLGIVPNSNGGIPTSYITQLGPVAGLTIHEYSIDTDGDAIINSSGLVGGSGQYAGSNIMMTFNKQVGLKKIGHAVVVIGMEDDNGKYYIKYYDPTTGEKGRRRKYSSLYYIKTND